MPPLLSFAAKHGYPIFYITRPRSRYRTAGAVPTGLTVNSRRPDHDEPLIGGEPRAAVARFRFAVP
jgi:hypothetical protein